MAKQKDLLTLLQRTLPRLASDIDHRMRVMRQGDDPLLPSGGRGPHAPELRPIDAAHMVIGALSLERPKDGNVVSEVKAMRSLRRLSKDSDFGRWEEEKSDGTGLKGCDFFIDALVIALTEGFHREIDFITLYPSSRTAVIKLHMVENGGYDFIGDPDRPPELIEVGFELSWSILKQIGHLLEPSEDISEN